MEKENIILDVIQKNYKDIQRKIWRTKPSNKNKLYELIKRYCCDNSDLIYFDDVFEKDMSKYYDIVINNSFFIAIFIGTKFRYNSSQDNNSPDVKTNPSLSSLPCTSK